MHRSKLFWQFAAYAAAGASSDDQCNGAFVHIHRGALTSAHLPAKLKRGNGLPKF